MGRPWVVHDGPRTNSGFVVLARGSSPMDLRPWIAHGSPGLRCLPVGHPRIHNDGPWVPHGPSMDLTRVLLGSPLAVHLMGLP